MVTLLLGNLQQLEPPRPRQPHRRRSPSRRTQPSPTMTGRGRHTNAKMMSRSDDQKCAARTIRGSSTSPLHMRDARVRLDCNAHEWQRTLSAPRLGSFGFHRNWVRMPHRSGSFEWRIAWVRSPGARRGFVRRAHGPGFVWISTRSGWFVQIAGSRVRSGCRRARVRSDLEPLGFVRATRLEVVSVGLPLHSGSSVRIRLKSSSFGCSRARGSFGFVPPGFVWLRRKTTPGSRSWPAESSSLTPSLDACGVDFPGMHLGSGGARTGLGPRSWSRGF
jgi:hypothetical protein